jgi:hypothetical protein
MVAAHAERIYKNIDYAISTRSNHTISEAFGLWLVGILFPELKDAEKYLRLGHRLLEQEATHRYSMMGAIPCIQSITIVSSCIFIFMRSGWEN